MKKLALVLVAVSGLLSACVAYEVPYRDGGLQRGDGQHDRGRAPDRDRDRDGIPNRVDRDRDGDGVPNRQDQRPNNPNRY